MHLTLGALIVYFTLRARKDELSDSLEDLLPGLFLAAVAGPFKKLGLSPDMAAKFVPILTQFAQSKGGADVARLLTGALK